MLRGNELTFSPVNNSFSRRAVLFQNIIINNLKKIGVHPDDVEFPTVRLPTRQMPAHVDWNFETDYCFLSHNSQKRYIDNLQIIAKLIETEIQKVLNEQITINQFIENFAEDPDILKHRKEARKTLQVDEHCTNIEEINKQYKLLAKKAHPDMSTGDPETFKKINEAHKILKKELEG